MFCESVYTTDPPEDVAHPANVKPVFEKAFAVNA